MKFFLTILVLVFSSYMSLAQVKVGDTGPGFYHVISNPQYVVEDVIWDWAYLDSTKFDLDLNGDTVNDITLFSKYWKSNDPWGGYYTYWGATIRVNSYTDITMINSSPYFADTLRINDTISNPQNTWSNSATYNYANLNANTNNYTVTNPWKNQTNKYIGFRIKSSSDTAYGWLSISVIGDKKIIIKEYACQSAYTTDTVFAVGIRSINEEAFKIYPNPFDDRIVVSTEKNLKICKADFFSPEGKLLNSVDAPGNVISTPDFKSGIYFMVIYFENNQISRKKIIKL